jgi:hypothetical protein
MLLFLLLLLSAAHVGAQSATDLWLRGYSVIPTPQVVQLDAGDVRVRGVEK